MVNVKAMDTDDQSSDSDSNNSKKFIDKVLGEMKYHFNKAEKKQDSSKKLNVFDDDVEIIDHSDIKTAEINLLNDKNTSNITSVSKSKFTKNLNNESVVVKPEVSEENKPSIEQSGNYTDSVKHENTSDDTNEIEDTDQKQEDKPRIVLTFRKPASNKMKPKPAEKDNLDRTCLKRSPRRRSRDYGESVLQSAIARKEKSYNEGSKPQRLTRQLKATPKILENLANAAKSRSDKSKRYVDKQKIVENDNSDSEMLNLDEDVQIESSAVPENEFHNKKPKHKHHSKHIKHIKKSKLDYHESTRDSDSDCGPYQDSSNSNIELSPTLAENKSNYKNYKNLSNADEKMYRRSHRLSRRHKESDQEMNSDDGMEANGAEQDVAFPETPECVSVEAQLIASRLCLCTQPSQMYISADNNEIVYCTAIDNVGDGLVGCNNVVDVNTTAMIRPSSRVPYVILCEIHKSRMVRHNCCPTCGIFCTQGRFVQCEGQHQYHRHCQISVGDVECCPHCGLSTPQCDILITMHSQKKPVFLPTRKDRPSAKMSFQSNDNKFKNIALNERPSSPPLIPVGSITVTVNSSESNKNYHIDILLDVLKNGDRDKLAVILGTRSVSLITSIDECNGGTVLHYAAQNGLLPEVHMLISAGADLDVLNMEQNTPLILAILSFKNDVVKYLIKAGASIDFKGMDGMTPLHLAAKVGNLIACELLLNKALKSNNYVDVADDGGWTALVWACEHAHVDVARFLILKGADPLLRDVEQNIALHWACFSGSSQITELLLDSGSDVNAVNAHGDTPLHIGARQNMYNCVIVLLARGANVNLINKTSKCPLDCALQPGECYMAISLTTRLQSVTSDGKTNHAILINDISRGKESNPIQCINTFDNEPYPTDFIYISENCITSDITIDVKINQLQYCLCEDKCANGSCTCCNNSLQCWYDEEGKLAADFNYRDPPMLFECNQVCKCNAITCSNRVVQHGLTQRFKLIRTEMKGWGVYTLRTIPKGTFVCEYIGEIITDIEADQREDDSYLFDLDNRETDTYCIDAKLYGNISRFINHSCEPNLVSVRVFINHQDLRFPRIAFFANRDILAEEELSFDYGEKFWLIKYKSFTCDCKSIKCKYAEETISTTIQNYNKKLQEDS